MLEKKYLFRFKTAMPAAGLWVAVKRTASVSRSDISKEEVVSKARPLAIVPDVKLLSQLKRSYYIYVANWMFV